MCPVSSSLFPKQMLWLLIIFSIHAHMLHFIINHTYIWCICMYRSSAGQTVIIMFLIIELIDMFAISWDFAMFNYIIKLLFPHVAYVHEISMLHTIKFPHTSSVFPYLTTCIHYKSTIQVELQSKYTMADNLGSDRSKLKWWKHNWKELVEERQYNVIGELQTKPKPELEDKLYSSNEENQIGKILQPIWDDAVGKQ